MLLLHIEDNSGSGNFVFTISNASDIPTLSPGAPVSATLNNTGTAIWQLYEVTDLETMTPYQFNFTHTPAAGNNLSTTYNLYSTNDFRLENLHEVQTQVSMDHWATYQRTVSSSFSASYAGYPVNTQQNETLFVGPSARHGLLVQVPDAPRCIMPAGTR